MLLRILLSSLLAISCIYMSIESNEMEVNKTGMIDIIKKINPKFKIVKHEKGFINWLMHKRKVTAICMPNTLHLRDDSYLSDLLLVHEGTHQMQMKRDGKLMFLLKYLFCWPFFKTKRYEYEAEAIYMEYFYLVVDYHLNFKSNNFSLFKNSSIHDLENISWGFAPYFYANIEYKKNYTSWYRKETLKLVEYGKKALGYSKRTEFEQDIYDLITNNNSRLYNE